MGVQEHLEMEDVDQHMDGVEEVEEDIMEEGGVLQMNQLQDELEVLVLSQVIQDVLLLKNILII
jgi:hypothetical protein